jgi:hypothetical protein
VLVTQVDRAIDALLADDIASSEPPPRRAVVEHLLTAGYAEILDLEAERLRVVRRLSSVAEGAASPGSVEVAALHGELARVTERVRDLRDRLAEVNRRFGAVT